MNLPGGSAGPGVDATEPGMVARIAAHDWSATPLGAAASWPQSLRTAVSVLLHSRFPMFLFWGPEAICLYNDAYRPSLGADMHPGALGHRGAELWSDIWHIIGPQIEGVMARAEQTWFEDQLVPFDRNGYLEEIYFTYGYSPVFDESGGVGGTLVVCTETTAHVVAQRRQATLLALSAAGAPTVEATLDAVAAVLAGAAADLAVTALYRLPDAAPVRSTGLRPGDVPPQPDADAWAAVAAGQRASVALPARPLPGGAWPEAVREMVLTPVAGGWALLAGLSPRRGFDAAYAGFLDLAAGAIGAALTRAGIEEDRRRRTEEIAALDRAKTAFFTGVSHELRTPLTLITGPVRDALEDAATPATGPQRERLELIGRNATRLGRLIDTMLDFARLEGGRLAAAPQPVDLAALTRGVAESFAPAAHRAGLAFTVDCRDVGTLLVDPDLWEKIVLNLLTNAVKYTPDGAVAVTVAPAGDGVELAVLDTGVGIPPGERERVFERFYRGEAPAGRSVEGSGIGLALVAELAALHGARVAVTAGPGGVGSRFTVALPAAARTALAPVVPARRAADVELPWDAAAPAGDAGVAGDAAPEGTVVLAEDNADLRAYVAGLLRPRYRVLTAGDGASALDLARREHADLVLSDVMMPGVDGFELLRRLRAHPVTSAIAVILLSARAGEEAVIEGLAAGADDYLVKPFSSHDLLARVRSTIAMARARASEATWRRTMIEALQDGFCVLDVARGRVTEINPALAAMLGLDPAALPYEEPFPFLPLPQEDGDEAELARAGFAGAAERGHGSMVLPLRHVGSRERVWVSVSFSALPGGDGRAEVLVCTLRDVTAERRAADRDALVAGTGRLLTEPLPIRERLARFVALAADALGGLVTVSGALPGGLLAPLAAAHRDDPERAKEWLARPPWPAPGVPHAGATVVDRTGPHADPALLDTFPMAGGAPATAAVVVPLTMADRVLGTLACVTAGGGVDPDDVTVAEDLGRRLAGVLETDRIAVREHHLQTVTAALAAAATLSEAAHALAEGVTTGVLDASDAAVYGVDAESRRLVLHHAAGAAVPAVVRLDARCAVAEAVRRREPVWQRHADLFSSGGTAAPAAETVEAAAVALPMITGGRVVGVLAARFAPRTVTAGERRFALTVAGQAAQSFDRAMLSDRRWEATQVLQRALLPAALPALDRVALAARYRPAAREIRAGGDWYTVLPLGGGRVALTVGDVVGHGAPAAAVMGQLRAVLSSALLAGAGPAGALRAADRFVALLPGARGSSALVLVLDPVSGEVTWSAAGHLPPLQVSAGSAAYLEAAPQVLLGAMPGVAYADATLRLEPGAAVVLYTDGLVERRGEILDDGLDRLAAAAAAGSGLGAEALAEHLLAIAGGPAETPADDTALLVARLTTDVPDVLEGVLPADPSALSAHRRRVVAWAAAAGVSGLAVDDLQLAFGEALANGVEHAYAGGGGEVRYRVSRVPGGDVEVVVSDGGRWRPPPAHPGRRGRGLAMIRAVAVGVAVAGTAQGTRVTFRIPHPQS